MKSAELHKLWGATDNSRLTAKQQSFRLPVHVAAKLDALCELYPSRTKTELVGDLLDAALEELIPNLPVKPGKLLTRSQEHGKVYEETGLRARFRQLTNERFKELESELGNDDAPNFYMGKYVISEEDGEPA